MGLFKKKKPPTVTEVKCPVEECAFICNDPEMLERHIDWKHPELTRKASN